MTAMEWEAVRRSAADGKLMDGTGTPARPKLVYSQAECFLYFEFPSDVYERGARSPRPKSSTGALCSSSKSGWRDRRSGSGGEPRNGASSESSGRSGSGVASYR
jgi:hypothetical protein